MSPQIPGLGAFSVYPDADGDAKGLAALATFLDQVIEHLSDRLTARERVTYHVHDAYRYPSGTTPSPMPLMYEHDDIYGREYRALPPAEQMVLVAWYREPLQVELAKRADGIAFVRLGKRRGALHVHPNLASVRHILLRAEGGTVCEGLFALREPGFSVQTREELRTTLQAGFGASGLAAWDREAAQDELEMIYAVFKVKADADWTECRWDGGRLLEVIEQFEAEKKNRLCVSVRRDSPFPRIISLERLLVSRRL